MANFFFTGGSGGQQAINLDQVRLVNQDTRRAGSLSTFSPNTQSCLRGDVAKQFMDVLGGLRSEAKVVAQGAVKRSNKAARTSVNLTPKPEPYGALKKTGSCRKQDVMILPSLRNDSGFPLLLGWFF
jgi:hypothetical protein